MMMIIREFFFFFFFSSWLNLVRQQMIGRIDEELIIIFETPWIIEWKEKKKKKNPTLIELQSVEEEKCQWIILDRLIFNQSWFISSSYSSFIVQS